MREISKQSENVVMVTGTLLNNEARIGKTKKDNRDYIGGNATVRVRQTYGGKEEISEPAVSYISMKKKNDGTPNPAYENINQFVDFETADRCGLEEATRICFSRGSLSENMYVNKGGAFSSFWKITNNFFSRAREGAEDCAVFNVEIFLFNIEREVDRDGEETGRLHLRGGIVGYRERLDVIDLFVEGEESVDYVERNWEVNQTVRAKGYIRFTTASVPKEHNELSFGEDIPDIQSVRKCELIITTGFVLEEEESFDPIDMKKLMAARNAVKETLIRDTKAKAKAATKEPVASSEDWE